MSINLSNIKWVWVVLGVIIAFVIAYGSSVCAVTGYATLLSFQVRGAPDMTLINEFAANNAGVITSLFIGLGTLVGGLLAGRKAQENPFVNGLMVGFLAAIVGLFLSFAGGFSLWTVVSFLLALGGGWLGGKLSNRRAGE